MLIDSWEIERQARQLRSAYIAAVLRSWGAWIKSWFKG